MIIEKNIDKTLWLILNTDKKNRDKIVDFVCNIPIELKRLIEDRIKMLNEYRETGQKKFTFLCGEFITDDNLLYWFEIDFDFNEIDLGYKKFNGSIYDDVFEMTLSLNSESSLKKIFDKKYIGRIEYDKRINNIDNVCSFLEFSESVYNLYKIPFGYVTTSGCKRGIDSFKCISNITNEDDELFLDDVLNVNSVNRLVRRKRK